MPNNPESFDFSSQEDQERFESLPAEGNKSANVRKNEIIQKQHSEGLFLNEKIEYGEASDVKEAIEQVIAERAELTNWVEANCKPEDIPEWVKKKGEIGWGDVMDSIEEAHGDQLHELLESDRTINSVASALTEVPVDRSDVPSIVYDRGNEQNARALLQELRQDNQRMAAFCLKVQGKFPHGCGCGGFGGFKEPSDCGGCVSGRTNLRSIFGQDIPFLKYTGERCYSMMPLGETNAKDMIGDTGWRGIDQMKLVALVGEEKGKLIADGFAETQDLLKVINEAKETERKIIGILGERYQQVLETMPEAIPFLTDLNLDQRQEVEIDLESKTIALTKNRSEWGNSGGTANFSRVIVWSDSQSQEREFQYTDRYDRNKDNWRYYFGEVSIDGVQDDESKSMRTVKITARANEKHQPVSINFELPRNVKTKELEELSIDQQAQFEGFVEDEQDRIMAEKIQHWEGNPKYLSSEQYDAGSYVDYQRPRILESDVKSRNGVAAFIVREQIDARGFDPQLRYELYVVKPGEPAKVVFEDHSYAREGDASLIGLRITGKKVKFNTENGPKEIDA